MDRIRLCGGNIKGYRISVMHYLFEFTPPLPETTKWSQYRVGLDNETQVYRKQLYSCRAICQFTCLDDSMKGTSTLVTS